MGTGLSLISLTIKNNNNDTNILHHNSRVACLLRQNGRITIKKTNKIKTMKKTILKYKLEVTDNQTILLPIGSKILTVQMQGETLCLWALVNQEEETESRFIEIFGTGHTILYDFGMSREYISTFQMNNGELVFHVFEYNGV